jgi:hypothetical protein
MAMKGAIIFISSQAFSGIYAPLRGIYQIKVLFSDALITFLAACFLSGLLSRTSILSGKTSVSPGSGQILISSSASLSPGKAIYKVVPMNVYILRLAMLTVALTVLICPAMSQEIVDLYSNLESADVTVEGNVNGSVLQLDLLSGSEVLQTRTLEIDGPGTWVATWSPIDAEEGNYRVCAKLSRDGRVLGEKCYTFLYGGPVPIRFDVRDFSADSRGIHLSISSQDPTMVDIYYMLITGDKALYITRAEGVSISGGLGATPVLSEPWRQILTEGKEYSGRVKIYERSHSQTRAFMDSFVAEDDASITETYEDETGASATVLGNSRVPFQGSLRFTLSRNGTVLEEIVEKTPVLLTGDDETVEVSWNRTLDPGLYQLQVLLIGNSGDIKDMDESVIEAEPIVQPAQNATETTQESPMPSMLSAVSLVLMAFVMLRLRKR